ncbi:MAG: hypothetical protein Q9187_006380, partial [Circinaria calcarea]
ARLADMLGELLQRRFADAAGRTDKDGDEARRKGRGDAGIRGLDVGKGDHGVACMEPAELPGWCAEN